MTDPDSSKQSWNSSLIGLFTAGRKRKAAPSDGPPESNESYPTSSSFIDLRSKIRTPGVNRTRQILNEIEKMGGSSAKKKPIYEIENSRWIDTTPRGPARRSIYTPSRVQEISANLAKNASRSPYSTLPYWKRSLHKPVGEDSSSVPNISTITAPGVEKRTGTNASTLPTHTPILKKVTTPRDLEPTYKPNVFSVDEPEIRIDSLPIAEELNGVPPPKVDKPLAGGFFSSLLDGNADLTFDFSAPLIRGPRTEDWKKSFLDSDADLDSDSESDESTTSPSQVNVTNTSVESQKTVESEQPKKVDVPAVPAAAPLPEKTPPVAQSTAKDTSTDVQDTAKAPTTDGPAAVPAVSVAFKPASEKWTCPECWTQSTLDKNECPCCMTPRPGASGAAPAAAAAPKPTAPAFKPTTFTAPTSSLFAFGVSATAANATTASTTGATSSAVNTAPSTTSAALTMSSAPASGTTASITPSATTTPAVPLFGLPAATTTAPTAITTAAVPLFGGLSTTSTAAPTTSTTTVSATTTAAPLFGGLSSITTAPFKFGNLENGAAKPPSFGVTPASTAATTSAPSFGFGLNTNGTTKTTVSSSVNGSSTFGFGSTSTATVATSAAAPTPFSFGAAPAAPTVKPAGGSIFGNLSGGTSTSNASTAFKTTPTPFSFGSTADQPAASAPASTWNTTVPSSFNFGSLSNGQPNANGQPAPFEFAAKPDATAPSPFSFGGADSANPIPTKRAAMTMFGDASAVPSIPTFGTPAPGPMPSNTNNMFAPTASASAAANRRRLVAKRRR